MAKSATYQAITACLSHEQSKQTCCAILSGNAQTTWIKCKKTNAAYLELTLTAAAIPGRNGGG